VALPGPYVHAIDPVIGTLAGVHLWWYGFSYTAGFLNAHRSIRRHAGALGLAPGAALDLSLLLALGVLFGGRFVEVAFYEWPFYREHPALIPAYWLGGMATHGLLFGGLLGIWLFSRFHRTPFLAITDALSIPAAVILALGRVGNFIDGQIVGSVTDVPWAVKFPDAEGFRHPVVLYDALKNLLIVPVLFYAGRRPLPSGVKTGVFLFLYAFLRIFVDFYREYPTSLLGVATGQALNILLSIVGLALIFSSLRTGNHPSTTPGERAHGGLGWRRALFAALLMLSLVIPSDWTQDIPARYGKRHPGLEHSILYPPIDPSPKN
jgi:phosphatidylglycerol:prolipoprotein diacylglycerol transferase